MEVGVRFFKGIAMPPAPYHFIVRAKSRTYLIMGRILHRLWKKLSTVVLNFLFPVECMRCGSEEDWLCKKCLGEVPRETRLACFTCRKQATDGKFCDDCRKGKTLLGIHAVAPYASEVLRDAIAALKYRNITVLAKPLAILFEQFMEQWPFLFSDTTLFIPVPLHPKKMSDRGYNQSHLLLAHLLEARGKNVCGCWLLSRTRHTKQQVDCTREERLQNVRNAFRYAGPSQTSWPSVVLCDDVATTGSTLEACAHALHAAGARDVRALVLARG